MAREKTVDEYFKNQFVFYYTLRYLWKLNEHPVGDLYKIFFPSKNAIGGNKTLYDSILGGKVSCGALEEYATKFEELTGLSKKYFTGENELTIPGLINEDWNKFIRLRQSSKESKSFELKQLEIKIKREIQNAEDNKSPSSEPLKRLMYFAEYKHKQEDKTLQDLFIEIESKIAKCRPSDCEKVDLQLLKGHQKVIQEYLYNISAVITARKWKEKGEKADN